MNDFVSAVILLALVTDPLGNLPVVSSMLSRLPVERRRTIILRECLIAYVLLLLFMLGGQQILTWMSLSQASLSIAGGVILFLIALRMIFKGEETHFGDAMPKEPFVVPLAVPMIAGPSSMATVMLMATREPQATGRLALAITLVMSISLVVFLLSEVLERILGKRVIEAIERLMGLVLTAIAVEMLLAGIKTFVQSLH